jgi:DNA-binding PadR family transcriptional regulator
MPSKSPMSRPDTTRKPDDLLPLTPAVFRIALALVTGGRHGYGIMRAINRMPHAKPYIGPGTLYRSLQRMRIDGLIEDMVDPAHADADEDRRRFYRLTRFGRAVLKSEAVRLAALVSLATSCGVLESERPAKTPSTRRQRPKDGRQPIA